MQKNRPAQTQLHPRFAGVGITGDESTSEEKKMNPSPLDQAKRLLREVIELAEIGDADDDASWHQVLEEARAFVRGNESPVETSESEPQP